MLCSCTGLCITTCAAVRASITAFACDDAAAHECLLACECECSHTRVCLRVFPRVHVCAGDSALGARACVQQAIARLLWCTNICGCVCACGYACMRVDACTCTHDYMPHAINKASMCAPCECVLVRTFECKCACACACRHAHCACVCMRARTCASAWKGVQVRASESSSACE